MSGGMYLKGSQNTGMCLGTTHIHKNKKTLDKITEEQLKAIESVKDKENSANKTTELSENSTDEQYPSAKAVVGYVGEKAQEAAKATDSIAEKLGGLTFSVAENGILTISKED